jgi:F0F1-type ATP synthase delta subunit
MELKLLGRAKNGYFYQIVTDKPLTDEQRKEVEELIKRQLEPAPTVSTIALTPSQINNLLS